MTRAAHRGSLPEAQPPSKTLLETLPEALRKSVRKTLSGTFRRPSRKSFRRPLRDVPPRSTPLSEPFGACRVSQDPFGVVPKPCRMPPSKPSLEPPSEPFGEGHVSRKPAKSPFETPRNRLRSTTPVPECRSRKPTSEASECAATLPEAPECAVKSRE